MVFPLVTLINKAVDSNLNKKAVTYYNGVNWHKSSYANLKEGIYEVQCLFREKQVENETQYVLLHLNITNTFPAIVLGVLNAGIGFICADPKNDKEINKYIEELSVKYIISNIFFYKSHQTQFLCNCILLQNIDLYGETIGLWCTNNEDKFFIKQPFLYAINTSGTTGIPKKVQVLHDCIFPNLIDLSSVLQITDTDTIMLMTPTTFDPSVVELFLALMNGATLCIIKNNLKQDPNLLLDVLFPLSGGLVSTLQITPSLFRRWNSLAIQQTLFSEKSILRNLILGGEEFPSINEVKSWNLPKDLNVYNIYGITEISCWSSIKKVWPATKIEIDIGKPLSETIFKLDVENGNEGELFIGSKTRKCIINDEIVEKICNSDDVLFRETGDIFKEDNGKLYFKRRKDDITKRWGIQFSTCFIEDAVKLHTNIAACSCITVQINHHTRIGLFIMKKNDLGLDDINCFLKRYLPRVSWPDVIISLDSFPLTDHGKICVQTLKKRLLEEKKTLSRDTFNEMWRHYSSEKSLGYNDFFSDGGDSLTALQLVGELKLIFNDMPDTILGMILQKKSCNEIWNYLLHCRGKKTNYIPIKIDEPTMAVVTLSNEKVKSTDINVTKVLLKGKITIFKNNISDNINISKQIKFKENWKRNMGKCIDASPLGVGLISGETICIIGSHSGRVAVIEINSGKLISECILPDRVESSACISVDAEFYYIGCYDGCVYSVSTMSGTIVWKFKTEDIVKSACIIVEDCIIFGSYDKNIYCLYKDGSLKWKTLTSNPVLGETVLNNNCLYSATLGSVAALNINTGQLIWEIKHGPVFSTPVFYNALLIVADVSGCVQWLNSDNGKEEYVYKANDMVFSSLVKCIINEKEIIIFGCQDGSVYCLKERKLYWKTALDTRIVSTPFVEFCEEAAGGLVVCSSTVGTIFILDFDTGEIISQYSLPGEVFSSPILINRKIIVGCRDDNVYCLDVK